jgi:hypothetical protein
LGSSLRAARLFSFSELARFSRAGFFVTDHLASFSPELLDQYLTHQIRRGHGLLLLHGCLTRDALDLGEQLAGKPHVGRASVLDLGFVPVHVLDPPFYAYYSTNKKTAPLEISKDCENISRISPVPGALLL